MTVNHEALRAWNSIHKPGTPVTVSMVPDRFHGAHRSMNFADGAGTMSRVSTITDGKARIDGRVSVVPLVGFSEPVPIRKVKAL